MDILKKYLKHQFLYKLRISKSNSLKALNVLLLIGLWHALSVKIGNSVLPQPLSVIREIIIVIKSEEYYLNLFITLKRIFISITYVFLLSLIISYLAQINKIIHSIIEFPFYILLMLPQMVIVFITVIIFKTRNNYTIPIAVILCTIPNIYMIISRGINSLNQEFFKMAKIFKISRFITFSNIIIPGISPHLITALETGLSLSWRSTMLAEMFCFNRGVGHQIYYQFELFSLKKVLAWSISFILTMQLLETIFKFIVRKIYDKK